MKEFIERNLFVTVDFLLKNKISPAVDVVLPAGTLPVLVAASKGDFYRLYASLLCGQSKDRTDALVFCSCCSAVTNFLRNHSLLQVRRGRVGGVAGIVGVGVVGTGCVTTSATTPTNLSPTTSTTPLSSALTTVISLPGSRPDPFLRYLEASVSRDVAVVLEVIQQVPLFWEAYLLLIELTDTFVPVETPLSVFYCAYLKILKDIGGGDKDITYNDTPCKSSVASPQGFALATMSSPQGFALATVSSPHLDTNTAAALLYCSGNHQKALETFKKIDFTGYFDPSFFEFYAILLYNTNDPSFPYLCECMKNFHKGRYETYVMLGLHSLAQGRAAEAKGLLRRAHKLHGSADIACLVAYAYFKMQDYENANSYYQQAGSCTNNNGNFRSLYSMAQGYFSMGKHAMCLAYCKKALEIRDDGTIYKLMGRAYQSLGDAEHAVRYFEHAGTLGEHDSLLYLAEIYKERNDRGKVLELYEQYLKTGEKNSKVVAGYLVDYYGEVGDFARMEEFKENLTKLS